MTIKELKEQVTLAPYVAGEAAKQLSLLVEERYKAMHEASCRYPQYAGVVELERATDAVCELQESASVLLRVYQAILDSRREQDDMDEARALASKPEPQDDASPVLEEVATSDCVTVYELK